MPLQLIVRDKPVRERFADLQLDRSQVLRARERIGEIVTESFGDREPTTDDELKRRIRICVDYFCDLYGDRGLGWSMNRTLEQIPLALGCEMAGLQYEPQPANGRGYRVHKPGDVPWKHL